MVVNWKDRYGKVYKSIENMPENSIGFIYRIEFTNGLKYIGKKHLYNIKTIKQPKSGAKTGTIKTIYRNTGKGFRQAYNIVQTESDWKTYQGSARLCYSLEPKDKIILHFVDNELMLTYMEVFYQFHNSVLEDNTYINDNILGKFYRNTLYGSNRTM